MGDGTEALYERLGEVLRDAQAIAPQFSPPSSQGEPAHQLFVSVLKALTEHCGPQGRELCSRAANAAVDCLSAGDVTGKVSANLVTVRGPV
jgi:hypothetical protein